MSRAKKTLVILLVVDFLLSVTTAIAITKDAKGIGLAIKFVTKN
jgi:hypothetical protein